MPLTYVPLRERPARRLPQLFTGLALYGFSLSLMVRAGLGLAPWSVLSEGIAHRSALSFGTLTTLVGAGVLLLWIPLRQRPTFGTFANILTVGWFSDLGLWLLPAGPGPTARAALFAAGVLANGFSIAVYVGARCGPGPRDGLMTGLTAWTGRSLRVVRTGIELVVLAVGWLLGGSVGLGTVLYAVTVGAVTQYCLPRFTYRAERDRADQDRAERHRLDRHRLDRDGDGRDRGAAPTRRTRRPSAASDPAPGH
ncbi:hypothetical protein AB0J38_15185 [Streptomyces sp. NPDC050095]|uniref:membrane protein YczE n=1 Tax=unclassified Streptomyces TaxID=2593676 RepID=UPI003422D11C